MAGPEKINTHTHTHTHTHICQKLMFRKQDIAKKYLVALTSGSIRTLRLLNEILSPYSPLISALTSTGAGSLEQTREPENELKISKQK